jgi:sodium-dependent phosphate cotransporter
LIEALLVLFTDDARLQGILLIAASALMIYGALVLLVRTMRSLLARRVEGAVSGVLDRNPVLAMAVGMIVTVMVQSSSITTSLLVPLGGAGVITLAQAFPVTIGANLGTTVTALLASLAVSGVNAEAGVTIALAHLLFNLSGTMVIYPVRRIRNIPLSAARWLADTATRSRWWALAYVLFLFYALPAILAFVSRY